MLVARRDPFHAGAPDAAWAQRPGFSERRVPRFARAVTVLQVVGSLLAIPVGLASEVAHPPMEIPGHGTFAIYIQGGIHHGLWQL